MKGTWQTDSGSGLAVPLAIGAAVLAVLIAGPVAAAVAELARAVVVIVVGVVVLAAIGGTVVVALRLRHGTPRALPSRVYGSTSVHAVQDRTEPRALPARPEVHLHFHRMTAEDVAAILARVNRDHGQDV